MIKRVLTFLFALLLCSPAWALETYYIPLAQTLNTETPPHLLKDFETPYAVNAQLEDGVVKKRNGITTVRNFATGCSGSPEILGYHRATQAYGVIFVGTPTSSATGQMWVWDMDVASPVMTVTKTGLSDDYDMQCINHYDDTVGACTLCTNGEDYIQYFSHDTLAAPTNLTTDVKGKYIQSYYDSLYIANVTKDITGGSDPYGVIYSEIGDASDFSVTEYYFTRPEDNLEIVGLNTHADLLYLGKGSNYTKNQLWRIAPRDNCARVSTQMGMSNQQGAVSSDDFYFNDKGRIFNLNGQWITKPIHTFFASSEAGTWDIQAVDNPYGREVLFTAGTRMFKYKQETGSWEMYDYGADVEVLSNKTPGTPWSEVIGVWAKHNQMTWAEEDTVADYLIKRDNAQLCVQNHFTDDDELPIDLYYRTKLDAMGDVKTVKQVQAVEIQAKYFSNCYYTTDTSNTFNVWGYFSNSPTKPADWTELGECVLDETGRCTVGCSERGIWTSIEVRESSRNPVEIQNIGVKYMPGGTL